MRTCPEGDVSTTKEQVSGQSWEQTVMICIGTSTSLKFFKTYQKQNRKAIRPIFQKTLGKDALEMIRDLRKNSEDSGRQSPETREQRKMVVGWRE